MHLVDRFRHGTLVVASAAAPVVGLQVVALVGQLGAVVTDPRAVHQERVLSVHAHQQVVGLPTDAFGRHNHRQELDLTVPRRRHRTLIAPTAAHHLYAYSGVVAHR